MGFPRRHPAGPRRHEPPERRAPQRTAHGTIAATPRAPTTPLPPPGAHTSTGTPPVRHGRATTSERVKRGRTATLARAGDGHSPARPGRTAIPRRAGEPDAPQHEPGEERLLPRTRGERTVSPADEPETTTLVHERATTTFRREPGAGAAGGPPAAQENGVRARRPWRTAGNATTAARGAKDPSASAPRHD